MDFEQKSIHGRQHGSRGRTDLARRRYTAVEQEWRVVLSGAQHLLDEALDHQLEAFLISILVPLTDPYLEAQEQARFRNKTLRWLGDTCLLYAGFYPEEARRREIALHHVVDLGQRAYRLFGMTQIEPLRAFYEDIAAGFVPMMDVLHGVYELAYERSALDPLCAYDLYQKTGSQGARRALAAVSGGSPVWSDAPSLLS